jgi:hypothetical protein
VDDSAAFAARVLVAHAAAMEVRLDEAALEIEIGSLTFTPGTYRSGSAINFAYGTVVTLDGENQPHPVFLFQAGTTLLWSLWTGKTSPTPCFSSKLAPPWLPLRTPIST